MLKKPRLLNLCLRKIQKSEAQSSFIDLFLSRTKNKTKTITTTKFTWLRDTFHFGRKVGPRCDSGKEAAIGHDFSHLAEVWTFRKINKKQQNKTMDTVFVCQYKKASRDYGERPARKHDSAFHWKVSRN